MSEFTLKELETRLSNLVDEAVKAAMVMVCDKLNTSIGSPEVTSVAIAATTIACSNLGLVFGVCPDKPVMGCEEGNGCCEKPWRRLSVTSLQFAMLVAMLSVEEIKALRNGISIQRGLGPDILTDAFKAHQKLFPGAKYDGVLDPGLLRALKKWKAKETESKEFANKELERIRSSMRTPPDSPDSPIH